MSKDSSHSHHVIVPVKYYAATFAALLVLTFITVFITRFDFGTLNIAIALIVAFAKASLVVMIFMGLRWDKGFNLVAFLGSLLFLGLFFAFVFADISYRDKGTSFNQTPIKLESPVREPSGHHGDHSKGHTSDKHDKGHKTDSHAKESHKSNAH